MDIRILCIGDIVGTPGRRIVLQRLRELRERFDVDMVVANAENATKGSGVTAAHARELFSAGVDVMTTGDHVWRRKDVIALMETDARILRAVNFTRAAPGRGFTVVSTDKGVEVGVAHAIGRVFMPPIDCPFAALDDAVTRMRARTPVIVVDMHCEATSEKVAMGRFLDGRVSVVFGTHTHVPTADACVLPGGTGYITDVGMTGPYDSVLGRKVDRVLKKFTTGMPSVFDVADGDPRISAALFTVDSASGRCREAGRLEVRMDEEPAVAGSGGPR